MIIFSSPLLLPFRPSPARPSASHPLDANEMRVECLGLEFVVFYSLDLLMDYPYAKPHVGSMQQLWMLFLALSVIPNTSSIASLILPRHVLWTPWYSLLCSTTKSRVRVLCSTSAVPVPFGTLHIQVGHQCSWFQFSMQVIRKPEVLGWIVPKRSSKNSHGQVQYV